MTEIRPTRCPCCGEEPIPDYVACEVETGVVYSCPSCGLLVSGVQPAVDIGASFISAEEREEVCRLTAAQREEREERMRRLPLGEGLLSDVDGRVVGLFQGLVDP